MHSNIEKFLKFEMNLDSVYGGGGVMSSSAGTLLSNNTIWTRGARYLEPDTTIGPKLYFNSEGGQHEYERINNQYQPNGSKWI